MKKLYTLAAALVALASHSQVVISQVYGGGGNNGAVYTHDFVELFNRGTSAVTLTGYTLQYASAAGASGFTASNILALPTVTIQPGKYYLIQQAKGNGGTTALPTPDFAPSTETTAVAPDRALALSGSAGRLALVSDSNLITSATDSNVVDFVGFGDNAITFEGNGPVPSLSNTTSAQRNGNGCIDTNNNVTDFTVADAAPRNSATAANTCVAGTTEFNLEAISLFPNPLSGNVLNIASESTAVKTVAIYDVLGKQVFNGKTANNAVNVNLTTGIYVVKITEGNKTATRKLAVK
jgi:hypothetical protein